MSRPCPGARDRSFAQGSSIVVARHWFRVDLGLKDYDAFTSMGGCSVRRGIGQGDLGLVGSGLNGGSGIDRRFAKGIRQRWICKVKGEPGTAAALESSRVALGLQDLD